MNSVYFKSIANQDSIVFQAMDAAWTHYSWKCEPVDFSNSPSAMRIAWGVYIYFLAKISELLDTVSNHICNATRYVGITTYL